MKIFKKENEPSKLTVIADDGREKKISDLEIINALKKERDDLELEYNLQITLYKELEDIVQKLDVRFQKKFWKDITDHLANLGGKRLPLSQRKKRHIEYINHLKCQQKECEEGTREWPNDN